MMIRFGIAFALAITFLVLGLSIQFGEPKPEVDVAIFFELAGEIPGVEFKVEGKTTWAPTLLCVDDSDPGLIDGQYRGSVLSIEVPEVTADDFLDQSKLFAAAVPGSTLSRVRKEGGGSMGVGTADFLWTCLLARGTDTLGVESDYLIVALAVHDEAKRFPKYYRAARALAIPILASEAGMPVIAKIRQNPIHFEGPLELPTRLTHLISLEFAIPETSPHPVDTPVEGTPRD